MGKSQGYNDKALGEEEEAAAEHSQSSSPHVAQTAATFLTPQV